MSSGRLDGRKSISFVRIDLDIEKKKETIVLKMTATDEHVIYTKGDWVLDKDSKNKTCAELFGKKGIFGRNNVGKVIKIVGKNASILLNGVDGSHGLSHGGKGKAEMSRAKKKELDKD